jgi:ubiquinone/menaquinone biosynthesis C-methylase UbiE
MIDDKYGLIDEKHVKIFENLLLKYGKGIVLDLGSGPRNPQGNKSQLVKKLICVDGSKQVEKEIKKEKLPNNCSFVFGDVCDLPFEDNYADLVLMIGIYSAIPPKELFIQSRKKYLSFQDYVKNTQKLMLQEAQRVVKPTGHLLASLNNKSIIKQLGEFKGYFNMSNVYKGERFLIEASPKIS